MKAVEAVIRGILATLPAAGVIATTMGGAASAMFLGAAQPAPGEPRIGSIPGVAEKQVTSLSLLPVDLRDKVAPAMLQGSIGAGLSGRLGPSASTSDLELDGACGDWFITWDEDADGRPLAHSFELHCGGRAPAPIG